MYKDILFRSRLEARWAAFLDLIDWKWAYEPTDYNGWTPDFQVLYRCGKSDCPPVGHLLSVEIKPTVKQLAQHLTNKDFFRHGDLPCGSITYFGPNPSITSWHMVCGNWGGNCKIPHFIEEWEKLWRVAGNHVMYKKPAVVQ